MIEQTTMNTIINTYKISMCVCVCVTAIAITLSKIVWLDEIVEDSYFFIKLWNFVHKCVMYSVVHASTFVVTYLLFYSSKSTTVYGDKKSDKGMQRKQ